MDVTSFECWAKTGREMGSRFSDDPITSDGAILWEQTSTPAPVSTKGGDRMLGFELKPDSPDASEVSGNMPPKGLICNAASSTVLGFTPPLALQEEEADWALDRLEAGIAEFI